MSTAAPASREERYVRSVARLRRRARVDRRWSDITVGVGVAIVVGIALVSLARPLLGLPAPDAQDLTATLAAPSWQHPFGTDAVGRDLLSRVLSATPLDYEVALITTYVPLVIGLMLGGIAGYFGGWLDAVIMRVVDVIIAFPFMIFVLAFVAIFGPGLTGIYIGLILFGWAFFARISRAEMLRLREEQFISAARLLGLPTRRVVFVHAVPNLLRPNLVFSMATIVLNILALAALSYLGLGVQPPRPEWGAIVADGQQYMFTSWWVTTLPGLVIVLVGVGFSLIGDGLADRLGYEIRLTA